MTDSSADDAAAGAGRQTEEALPAIRGRAENIASLDESSNAQQPSADIVDDSRPNEESAGVQGEAIDLSASNAGCDAGTRKPDVDVLAKGVASVLGPVMDNFDGGIKGVLQSQNVLSSSIDRLTRELDKLLEDVPHPYTTHHATRLSGIHKRVIGVNTTLRIIQKRIETIQRLLAGHASRAATGSKQKKASVTGSSSSSRAYRHNSNDEVRKNDDSEVPNPSKSVPSGQSSDTGIGDKGDLKDDRVSLPNPQAFIDQESDDKIASENESVGKVDVKGG